MPTHAGLRTTLILSTILLASACSAKAPGPAMSASVGSAVASANSAAPKTTSPSPAPMEGVDYQLIEKPDPISGPKVQVVEVFSFGCSHCFEFQPDLANWLKTLPSDVKFAYLPGPFGHLSEEFAHAFYAAESMGVQDKSHDGIFKGIWVEQRVRTADDIPKLYADYGVDPKTFASTMQTFAVSAKVTTASDQEVRWGVSGTPTIVVDGKYRVMMTSAGDPKAMLRTVDWLIAKQRPEHAKH
ncbi:MAG TPA: thiol:disulfide interchange protein DsbA/DsbL [Xanthomonadaceae bacterium]|nr:thiol:disulfide interchange protein DsbA/DsbL [Xanthomonadaceae bacterium]